MKEHLKHIKRISTKNGYRYYDQRNKRWIKSTEYNIVARSVNRPILPSQRKKEIYIPGKDGVYDFYDGTYENRLIEIKKKNDSLFTANIHLNKKFNTLYIYYNISEINEALINSISKYENYDDE